MYFYVFEKTENKIAFPAKKSSNLSRLVVMIDVGRWFFAAYGTKFALLNVKSAPSCFIHPISFF